MLSSSCLLCESNAEVSSDGICAAACLPNSQKWGNAGFSRAPQKLTPNPQNCVPYELTKLSGNGDALVRVPQGHANVCEPARCSGSMYATPRACVCEGVASAAALILASLEPLRHATHPQILVIAYWCLQNHSQNLRSLPKRATLGA